MTAIIPSVTVKGARSTFELRTLAEMARNLYARFECDYPEHCPTDTERCGSCIHDALHVDRKARDPIIAVRDIGLGDELACSMWWTKARNIVVERMDR